MREPTNVAANRGHETVGRPFVDLGRRGHLQDAATVHHGHPIGDRHGLGLVVRDENRGDADAVLNAPYLVAQTVSNGGIQRSKRFVEKQNVGFGGESARQRDALLLAARKLIGVAVGQRGHSDQLE